MADEDQGASSGAPVRGSRVGREGSGALSRGQLLPVLLAVGGALIALLIGLGASNSGSGASATGARTARSTSDLGASGPATSASGGTGRAGNGGLSTATSMAVPPGAPLPCTPTDVTITTTTDRTSYSSDDSVTVVTKLVSVTVCELDLVPSGAYECGESIVVDTWSGQQAYPMLGQSEQCGSLPKGVVTPGTVETATVVWSPKARSATTAGTGSVVANRYQAVGSWSWSAGVGKPPYQVAVDSASFTIGP